MLPAGVYSERVSSQFHFRDFRGNRAAVDHLRRAIAAGRLPHSLLISGPRGSGKYTASVLLAMALCCERQPCVVEDGAELADFCGECRNCTRMADALPLEQRVAEAIEAREELRETDKKETRILVQTHPDLVVIPPDPPQLLVKLGQVRSLIGSIYSVPLESRRKVYIFSQSAFMKEAANSLLKVLEEPPAYAHIILLAEHAGELLPTIRSRCAHVRFGSMPFEEMEALLAFRRPEWKPQERALVARLSNGAAGRALGFDAPAYIAARADALVLMRSAILEGEHTDLFKITETYRAGADGQAKTNAMLSAFAGVLEDLLLIRAATPDLVRNIDIRKDLMTLADSVSFAWIENAVRGLDAVYSGMRRNLLRSLSLDAFAEDLAGHVR